MAQPVKQTVRYVLYLGFGQGSAVPVHTREKYPKGR